MTYCSLVKAREQKRGGKKKVVCEEKPVIAYAFSLLFDECESMVVAVIKMGKKKKKNNNNNSKSKKKKKTVILNRVTSEAIHT